MSARAVSVPLTQLRAAGTDPPRKERDASRADADAHSLRAADAAQPAPHGGAERPPISGWCWDERLRTAVAAVASPHAPERVARRSDSDYF
jgi:hypothetical protein